MSGPSSKAQLIIASALLIAFFALAVGMLIWGANTWEQRVYVFGSVEAIVFTAVGWIFGREVNRQTAETAKQDAAAAKQDAKAMADEVNELTKEAEKGRTFALAVENARGGGVAGSEPRDSSAEPMEGVSSSPASGDDALASMQRLAAQLYK